MSIFKAYDVRGIYPKELNKEVAYKIGRAFATFLNKKNIVVGHDMRLSSEELLNGLVEGITDQGSNVIDIGLVSTPMSYFGCGFLKADGSIMITASHNPKEYNGFKFTRENAIPISGDTGIKDIENIFLKNKFKDADKKGTVVKRDIIENYRKHVLSFIDLNKIKNLNIVIDTANGMGGKDIPLIFEKLPCKVTPMYFNLDGTFPNHEADPLKEKNVEELKKKVLKEKADLGAAFDGDADRVFFISDKGEKIPSDFITCLIAKEFLKKNPSSTILYDLRSSWIVKEVIEGNNGKASMSKVGHAFIKEQLRKENAIFGGELSGHFYFRDNFNTDSGIIACLKIIELISKENKKLSQLIEPLKKYFASGEINSEVEDKEGKINELEEIYKDGKISRLDGLRVEYDDWWFNVRPSNTEPLLRLNLEAKSKELMEEKRDEILVIIRK